MDLLSYRIEGVRDVEGRINYIHDGGLKALAAEEVGVLGRQVLEIFRKDAPKAKNHDAQRDREPFFESLMGVSAPAIAGFGFAVTTTQGWLRDILRFGTRPHDIWAGHYNGGGAKVLAFEAGGAMVFTPYVRHPGTRPNLWEDRALSEAYPLVMIAGNRIGIRVQGFFGGLGRP